MSLADIVSALSNSLSLGSILILTALGLAITFGVMRVINMAHGEMLMLGAYTTLVITDPHYLGPGSNTWQNSMVPLLSWLNLRTEPEFWREYSLFWAIPISFVVVGFVGYLLEVGLVRFLYDRPLDTLLATWGVGMILQQLILLKFEANLQPMHMPQILDGHVEIGDEVNIPKYRIFIVGITLLCLLAVYLWFYRTSFGLKSRAVVQNRSMASALGISTRRVDAWTFAFATGLAGVAGCILSPLYTVKYNMGADYIVEAFMVVILGGMGQLSGSVAGGAVIGTGDSFVEKLLGNTSMAKVVMLLIVIAIICVRPSGLFATKERSYE
jgi:urea transport system permease protein